MSADELHAPSMARRAGENTGAACGVLARAARAFLLACEALARRHTSFGGGRLKIHAAAGRLDFHRKEMFDWMDDKTWSRCVISSEGLVRAGRLAGRPDAVPISEEGPLSLFLFPGAEFLSAPRSARATSLFVRSSTGLSTSTAPERRAARRSPGGGTLSAANSVAARLATRSP
jgi:hypothetical protein